MDKKIKENIKESFKDYLYYGLCLNLETTNAMTDIIDIVDGFEEDFLDIVNEEAINLLPANNRENYVRNQQYYENLFLLIVQTKFFNGLNRDKRYLCKNCIDESNVKLLLNKIYLASDFIESKKLDKYTEEIAVLGTTYELMEQSIGYAIKEIKRVNEGNKPVKLTILTGDRPVFSNELQNKLIRQARSYEEILSINSLTQEQIRVIDYYRKQDYPIYFLGLDLLNLTEYDAAIILAQELVSPNVNQESLPCMKESINIQNTEPRSSVPSYVKIEVLNTTKKHLNTGHVRTDDTGETLIAKYPNCRTFFTNQPFLQQQKKQLERIMGDDIKMCTTSAGNTLKTYAKINSGYDDSLKILSTRLASIPMKIQAVQTLMESVSSLCFANYENEHSEQEIKNFQESVKKTKIEMIKLAEKKKKEEEKQNNNNNETQKDKEQEETSSGDTQDFEDEEIIKLESRNNSIEGELLALSSSFKIKNKQTRKMIKDFHSNHESMPFDKLFANFDKIMNSIGDELGDNKVFKHAMIISDSLKGEYMGNLFKSITITAQNRIDMENENRITDLLDNDNGIPVFV